VLHACGFAPSGRRTEIFLSIGIRREIASVWASSRSPAMHGSSIIDEPLGDRAASVGVVRLTYLLSQNTNLRWLKHVHQAPQPEQARH
jgi:hypothetical protein